MSFIEANHIDGVEFKDIISNPDNAAFLIEECGKNQVPCLVIDGKPLYESEDIIKYLKENCVK